MPARRSNLDAATLAAAVRQAVRPFAPGMPANEWRTLASLVDRPLSPRRFIVFLLGGFAIFALILAALGIDAVVAGSLRVAAAGIAIGLLLALSAAKAIEGLLFRSRHGHGHLRRDGRRVANHDSSSRACAGEPASRVNPLEDPPPRLIACGARPYRSPSA